jgi:Ni,Fe-hydrogenase III large subunit
MNRPQPLLCCNLRDLAPTDLPDFARACGERLDCGERLLTLFGRTEPRGVVLTAVFAAADGPLEILRGRARPGEHYPALTATHPAAQIFERELWEQTGIEPDDHPWLKPVRFEGDRQQRMADYPFFKVRGNEVHEVGVGPIHAGVIEPGHFRFMCLGEAVHHLEIQLGYQHRGVESLLLRRPPMALAAIVESVCGDSSVAYAWGYCSAVEALSASSISDKTGLLRGIALEIERIAMHLSTLNGLATDIAFLQGTGTYGRLRTAIINASQRVCGNRFGRGWLRPGKTRGISDALRIDLIETLSALSRDVAGINDLMRSARSVRARFRGAGVVSAKAAQELGLSGLVARASGVALDTRSQLPGRLYQRFPVETMSESTGDCWARMNLRMRETDSSLAWLLNILRDEKIDLSSDEADEKSGIKSGSGILNAPLRPDALCVSLIEGARGPVVQVLETSGQGQLLHYKMQDPSLTNWFGLAMAVRDNPISDFPICNKSFDLSYCGNDL